MEGPSEALSLPVYLYRHGVSYAKLGLAVVPVYGKGSLAKWRRIFTAHGILVHVVFDNDSRDDSTGSKRRDALASPGVPADEREDAVATEDWHIRSAYTVFGNDFETSLRSAFPECAALEALAREGGAEAKPFCARWVAEGLPIDSAEGWDKMRDFAATVIALISSPSRPSSSA